MKMTDMESEYILRPFSFTGFFNLLEPSQNHMDIM